MFWILLTLWWWDVTWIFCFRENKISWSALHFIKSCHVHPDQSSVQSIILHKSLLRSFFTKIEQIQGVNRCLQVYREWTFVTTREQKKKKKMPKNYPHTNQWSLKHKLIIMEIVTIQNTRNIQNVAIIDATLQVSLCTQVNHIHFNSF